MCLIAYMCAAPNASNNYGVRMGLYGGTASSQFVRLINSRTGPAKKYGVVGLRLWGWQGHNHHKLPRRRQACRDHTFQRGTTGADTLIPEYIVLSTSSLLENHPRSRPRGICRLLMINCSRKLQAI